MKVEYNGHIMTFSNEGARKFEECLMAPLSDLAPVYIRQWLREKG